MFGVCLRISKVEHTGAEEFSRMFVLLLQRLQLQRGTRKPRLTGNPWPSALPQESQGFHSPGSQEAKRGSRDRWADVLTPWKTVAEHRAKLHEQPRAENRTCEGEGRNQSGFSGQVTQWL